MVSGKTDSRKTIGRQPTVRALSRIAKRVYGVRNPVIDPLKNIATPDNDDYVLRTAIDKKDVSGSF